MFAFPGTDQGAQARPPLLGCNGHICHVSYAADAFVFDVEELLLCELHVQEVLEHQAVPEHGTLQGKQRNVSKKHLERR